MTQLVDEDKKLVRTGYGINDELIRAIEHAEISITMNVIKSKLMDMEPEDNNLSN